MGILIPKIFDDIPEEGTIHTFGLFPEFRGQGLGKILHAKGLEVLSELGATRYVGSTDRQNEPMIATFQANGCQKMGLRRQYRQSR
jgi:ribosomal protein S18 acetylase RimI-like enzyme